MFAPLARRFQSIDKSPTLFARGWSLWPPFWGAGIRVERISADFREVDVAMRLTLKNKNYVGTHFGGSLYAMTDPFYMIMLLKNLGRGYIVWDKSAAINFKKPGRGTVRAQFRLSEDDLLEIREAVAKSERKTHLWERKVLVQDEQGETVAIVDKVLYVRLKE